MEGLQGQNHRERAQGYYVKQIFHFIGSTSVGIDHSRIKSTAELKNLLMQC